jgi:hypothetical protein
MKAEKFDDLVKARAHERVEAKIDKFYQGLAAALVDFVGPMDWQIRDYNPHHAAAASARRSCQSKLGAELLCMATVEKDKRVWPRALFEHEERLVRNELLATMNEFQQALIAAGKFIPTELQEPEVIKETK